MQSISDKESIKYLTLHRKIHWVWAFSIQTLSKEHLLINRKKGGERKRDRDRKKERVLAKT